MPRDKVKIEADFNKDGTVDEIYAGKADEISSDRLGEGLYNKLENGVNKLTLQQASSTVLGGMKLGTGFTQGQNGVVNVITTYTHPDHHSADMIVEGENFNSVFTKLDRTKLDSIDPNASNYDLPVATEDILGGVKSGGDIIVDGEGNVSITRKGVPVATVDSAGTVIVPVSGNIDVNGLGEISVPKATTSSVGVVQVGSRLSVNDGILSADIQTNDVSNWNTITNKPATLPSNWVAQTGVIGGVKPGENIVLHQDGTIDATANLTVSPITASNTPPLNLPANGLWIDTSEQYVTGTTPNIPLASESTPGLMTIAPDSGLSLVDGVLSLTQQPSANGPGGTLYLYSNAHGGL